MFKIVVQQLPHHAGHQDRSAHVLHLDVGGQSGFIRSTARSTRHELNLVLSAGGAHFMSIADGDDED